MYTHFVDANGDWEHSLATYEETKAFNITILLAQLQPLFWLQKVGKKERQINGSMMHSIWRSDVRARCGEIATTFKS